MFDCERVGFPSYNKAFAAFVTSLPALAGVTVIDDFNNVINTVARKFDDTYTLTRVAPRRGSITQTASEVFEEIGQLSVSGKLDDAKALLKQLRDQGRGTLRNAA